MSRLQLRKIGYLKVDMEEVFNEFDGQIFILETAIYQVFKSLTEKDLSDTLAEINMSLRDFVRNHFADRFMTVDDMHSPGFLRRQVADEIRAIAAPMPKQVENLNHTAAAGGASAHVDANSSKSSPNRTLESAHPYIVESAQSLHSSSAFLAPKSKMNETVKSSSSEDEMPTHDSTLPASIRAPPIKRTTVRHPAPPKPSESNGFRPNDAPAAQNETSSTTSSTSAAKAPTLSKSGVWAPASSAGMADWRRDAAKMIAEHNSRTNMLDEAALIDLDHSEPNDPTPNIKQESIIEVMPVAESVEDEESAEERARRRANSPKRRLAEAAEAEIDCFENLGPQDGSDSPLDSMGKPRDAFTEIMENARVEVRYQREEQKPKPLPRSHEVPVAEELEDLSSLTDKQPSMVDTTKLFYRVQAGGIPNATEVNSYRDKYEEFVALNTRLYEEPPFNPIVSRLRDGNEYCAYVIFLLKYIQHHFPSGITPHDLQRLEDDLSLPNPAERYLGTTTTLTSFAEFYDQGYLYVKRGVIYPVEELVDIELWGLPPGLPSNLYRLLSHDDQLVCDVPEHVGILLQPNKEPCYLQAEDIVRVANCYPLIFTIKAHAAEQYSLRNARISLHKDLPRWKVLLDDMTFMTKTPRHCDCYNCVGYSVVGVPENVD